MRRLARSECSSQLSSRFLALATRHSTSSKSVWLGCMHYSECVLASVFIKPVATCTCTAACRGCSDRDTRVLKLQFREHRRSTQDYAQPHQESQLFGRTHLDTITIRNRYGCFPTARLAGEIVRPEVSTTSKSRTRCCLGIPFPALLVSLYDLGLKRDVQSFSIATCLT
jgi:hypothetical protein